MTDDNIQATIGYLADQLAVLDFQLKQLKEERDNVAAQLRMLLTPGTAVPTSDGLSTVIAYRRRTIDPAKFEAHYPHEQYPQLYTLKINAGAVKEYREQVREDPRIYKEQTIVTVKQND